MNISRTAVHLFFFTACLFTLLVVNSLGVLATELPVNIHVESPQPSEPTTIKATPEDLRVWKQKQLRAPINNDLLTIDKSLSKSYEGINYDSNASLTGDYAIPADSFGAVGPKHIVHVVNRSIAWQLRNSTNFQVSQSLRNFFAPLLPLTGTYNPKVIYDHFNKRFVVISLERIDFGLNDPNNQSRILIAVSTTNDPNGAWNYAAINSNIEIEQRATWADYPGIAFDKDVLYVTTNQFAFGTRSYSGTRLWLINKGKTNGFYAGEPLQVSNFNPYLEAGITTLNAPLQPATIFPNDITGPAPILAWGTFLVAYSGQTDGLQESLSIIRVVNPLVNPSFIYQRLNVGKIDNTSLDLPAASQLGTNATLETSDRRVTQAVWRNHSLWASATLLPISGPDKDQTTVHWWKIDTRNESNLKLLAQGDIGAEDLGANTYTFYPTIAVNAVGDAAIGFSAAGPQMYPSASYARLIKTSAGHQLQPSEYLAEGLDYYYRTHFSQRNRWGNYSSMVVDPTDDWSFCATHHYAGQRGTLRDGEDGRWATRIGCFPPKEGLASDLMLKANYVEQAETDHEALTVDVVITNRGPSSANDVVFSSAYVNNAVLTEILTTQGSCNLDRPAICRLGALSNDAKATVRLVFTADIGQSLVYTNRVVSENADQITQNNTAIHISHEKCFGHVPTIIGTESDDTIHGTIEPDVILGRGGDDVIIGLGDNDLICGNSGDDMIRGGLANDKLSGGPGYDNLQGGTGIDACVSGEELLDCE